MPASFAVRPGGRVIVSELNSCSSSPRLRFRTNGAEEPAFEPVVPASSFGANGRAPGEEAQPDPAPSSKLELGWASGVPGADHASRSVVVVKVPHVFGVDSDARGPLKNS